VIIDAPDHDRAMTWVSHLPHAVAVALARAAAEGASGRLEELAGPGFLDTTRIAGRRTDLALELALADPEALARAIDAVGVELRMLASALREGDRDALTRLYLDAAADRRAAETGNRPETAKG
jgi:prephenate dehydrogenase